MKVLIYLFNNLHSLQGIALNISFIKSTVHSWFESISSKVTKLAPI